MSPLAVPENCGAMSIGIAHIGPMASSRKKNPRARQMGHRHQAAQEHHRDEARDGAR